MSYHTSTGTRKESGFTLSHAKLVSTLRSRCKLEIRHTTISTPSHTKLVPVQHLRRKLETQYDCLCTHNNVTTASVISHAKLVSRPFSRYHARSIIWHKPICSRAEELLIKAIFQHRRQQHRNSIMSAARATDFTTYGRAWHSPSLSFAFFSGGPRHPGRVSSPQARLYSPLCNFLYEQIYRRCSSQLGRWRIGCSSWQGEVISSRSIHGASTSDIIARTWSSRISGIIIIYKYC